MENQTFKMSDEDPFGDGDDDILSAAADACDKGPTSLTDAQVRRRMLHKNMIFSKNDETYFLFRDLVLKRTN